MSLPSMMLRKYKIYLLIFLFSFQQSFSQQSRNSLEKQRDNNLLKIEQAERIINETEKSKKITVGKLNVINKQIINRQDLIINLKRDVKAQTSEILTLRSLISSLKKDFKVLNDEYSEMIYHSYKSRSSLDRLSFIFSSKSYNQMFRRFNYIFQYSKFR